MRSKAVSVIQYIAEQPSEWQPTLKKLRAACRKQLTGYAETMSYGMPSYRRGQQIEVGFAQQAHYLSLYILKRPVFEAHRSELEGLSLGQGCIRYRAARSDRLGRGGRPAGGHPRQRGFDLLTQGAAAGAYGRKNSTCYLNRPCYLYHEPRAPLGLKSVPSAALLMQEEVLQ
jgi:uncharacterized protein YdhG (YjbR/CyaY superfamily)